MRVTMGRVAGLLFLVGSATTVVAIALPHSPQADIAGFWGIAIGTALGAALLLGFSARLPNWLYPGVMVVGTAIVSLSLYFNGERHGGPPADNEVLYLWVALYSGYFFSRTKMIAQLIVIGGAYAGALLAIHPGQIGFTRWLITFSMVSVAASLVHALKLRNDQLVARLFEAARTDRLTGLANRQGFDERLELELARGRRTAQPIALILADIDYFKELNDRLGHQAGDAALSAVGQVAREIGRSIDTMARIGGDEFAAILPDTDALGAFDLAERLRREVAALPPGRREPLTMSFGVVEFPTHGQTAEGLIRAADDALYEAKRHGRDRGVVQQMAAPRRMLRAH
jgi:diguanylate cyclase (GGDEF)-like protein